KAPETRWNLKGVEANLCFESVEHPKLGFLFFPVQKYFDSGDYNMAKAKMKNKQLPSAGPDKNLVTGDHIPTPQDLPQRKSSLVTSKLAG
uniref:Alpha-endosulfine n=1 Tax=Geospiza parvula TaxID=87175 RepID=A0A8U8C7E9_GEOPR